MMILNKGEMTSWICMAVKQQEYLVAIGYKHMDFWEEII